MEDPLPTQTDSLRAGRLRKSTPSSSERIGASIASENGPGRAAGEKQTDASAAKAPLEQRMASLAAALRRARIENAEHSAAVADLRAAEIVRLEMLADALAPVLAQVPADCDFFDLAVSPGERPRLFIDQIGFVEMERDRRTYRFLQDTRHGRISLCESADMEDIVAAATNYVAHRLIEREKALAVDYASGGAARLVRDVTTTRQKNGALAAKAFQAFLFFIEFLGAAAFFGLVAVIAMWAFRTYWAG